MAAESSERPCKGGCGAIVRMVKHERSGIPAPLVKAKGDEKPNITIYDSPDGGGEVYHCALKNDPPGAFVAEWVNHFMNCPMSRQFRGRKKGN